MNENCGSNSFLKIFFEKYFTHVVNSTARPRFSSISLYDQPFARYCTFYHFSILKYKSPTLFFNFWQIPKICDFIFPYDCPIYRTVWLRSDQNYRKSSVLEFPAPYGPALPTISKCHKIFSLLPDRQNIYIFLFPYDHLIYGKDWLTSDENCRRSSVLKCCSHWVPS